MKTLSINLVLICFGTLSAFCQSSWTNRYIGPASSDVATAIAVDGDGNVIVTGSSKNGGTYYDAYDFATVKYSNGGIALWTNRYASEETFSVDEPSALAVDAGGNVFVTGHSSLLNGFVNYGYVTIKYSGAGVPLWTNRQDGTGTVGYDSARAIAVDGNGNAFVTGTSSGDGSSQDFLTIKYSPAGATLWANRFSSPGIVNDGPIAIAVDSDGKVFVTGTSYGASGSGDFVTIAYSNGGTALWTNRYSDLVHSNNIASALALDNSGNVFVTGVASGGAGSSYATIKYSNAGVPIWTNLLPGFNAYAKAIAADGQDNVFVTGTTVTIKYSNAGVPLWTNNLSGRAIGVDGSGNVFVVRDATGFFDSRGYSNSGQLLWASTYYEGGNGAEALALDSNGNVFVTGTLVSPGYTTIKYPALVSQQAAVLENPQVIANEFMFDLLAEPGGQFAVQVSTNLLDWEVIRQVTIPAGGSTNIAEAFTSQAGKKYYRAQRQ